jgi:hypothetical protein
LGVCFPFSFWSFAGPLIGDRPNDKYAGCCHKVYPHLVACEGFGKDTEWSYSACLCKISQNVSSRKKKDPEWI